MRNDSSFTPNDLAASFEDEIRAIADSDQLETSLVKTAGMLGVLFRALLNESFTREEALELSMEWMRKALLGENDAVDE